MKMKRSLHTFFPLTKYSVFACCRTVGVLDRHVISDRLVCPWIAPITSRSFSAEMLQTCQMSRIIKQTKKKKSWFKIKTKNRSQPQHFKNIRPPHHKLLTSFFPTLHKKRFLTEENKTLKKYIKIPESTFKFKRKIEVSDNIPSPPKKKKNIHPHRKKKKKKKRIKKRTLEKKTKQKPSSFLNFERKIKVWDNPKENQNPPFHFQKKKKKKKN